MTDSLGGAWRIAVSTLERLYYEYEPRVRWMMHARGVEASSVDDLVHESFMTILRRWPRRDRSIPLAVWVVRVARNVAFSHRRAEARRRRRHQELPPPQAPAAPDEIAAGREAWHELDAFTRQLPPKLREAFVLADVGGVPVHEIAEACGVPVATMHSRLRLSRRRFAEHFARHRDAEARAAMLRRATTEARPSPEARRRSLAALLASAELPVATTAAAGTVTSTVTAWVVASVVAGVGAMVVIDRSLDPPPEPLAAAAGRQDAPAGRRDARSAKAAALSGVVESAAAVEQPETTVAVAPVASDASAPNDTQAAKAATVRPRRPHGADDPSPNAVQAPDPLAAHVAALERARSLTRAGRPRQALAGLDAVRDATSALARDHQRLVLQAACAADLPVRAREAGRSLAAMGLAVDLDAPCPAPPSESIE